jgi:hypothetical protein
MAYLTCIYASAAVNWLKKKINQFTAARSWHSDPGLRQAVPLPARHDTKSKTAKFTADTIQIVTGFGGGDCGYEFEIGKDYIIYGEAWKEKTVSVRHRKRKNKKELLRVQLPTSSILTFAG